MGNFQTCIKNILSIFFVIALTSQMISQHWLLCNARASTRLQINTLDDYGFPIKDAY